MTDDVSMLKDGMVPSLSRVGACLVLVRSAEYSRTKALFRLVCSNGFVSAGRIIIFEYVWIPKQDSKSGGWDHIWKWKANPNDINTDDILFPVPWLCC